MQRPSPIPSQQPNQRILSIFKEGYPSSFQHRLCLTICAQPRSTLHALPSTSHVNDDLVIIEPPSFACIHHRRPTARVMKGWSEDGWYIFISQLFLERWPKVGQCIELDRSCACCCARPILPQCGRSRLWIYMVSTDNPNCKKMTLTLTTQVGPDESHHGVRIIIKNPQPC